MSDYPAGSTAKPYFRYIDGKEDPIPQTLHQMFKYEPDWAMSRFRHMEKEITTQQATIAELEDPSWEQFIAGAEKWMLKYPPDIFDGSSGDKGPLFVVALHKALAALKEKDRE